VQDVLRHVEDKRTFICFQLPKSFAEAVIDVVSMIDLHRCPGCELRHRVLVEHALRIVRIAQRGVSGQHQDRRSMQAR
jgi:uncharacterized protein YecE (DUF72 family)